MKAKPERTSRIQFNKLSKFDFFRPFFDEKTGKPIKNNIIGTILFLAAFAILIFFIEQRRKQKDADRQKSPCYTIGYSFEVNYNLKRSSVLYYKCAINQKEYEGYTNVDYFDYDFVKNRAYLVQFEKEDPTNNEIFLDCRVPDSIQYYPSAGWDSLPGWAKGCQ